MDAYSVKQQREFRERQDGKWAEAGAREIAKHLRATIDRADPRVVQNLFDSDWFMKLEQKHRGDIPKVMKEVARTVRKLKSRLLLIQKSAEDRAGEAAGSRTTANNRMGGTPWELAEELGLDDKNDRLLRILCNDDLIKGAIDLADAFEVLGDMNGVVRGKTMEASRNAAAKLFNREWAEGKVAKIKAAEEVATQQYIAAESRNDQMMAGIGGIMHDNTIAEVFKSFGINENTLHENRMNPDLFSNVVERLKNAVSDHERFPDPLYRQTIQGYIKTLAEHKGIVKAIEMHRDTQDKLAAAAHDVMRPWATNERGEPISEIIGTAEYPGERQK